MVAAKVLAGIANRSESEDHHAQLMKHTKRGDTLALKPALENKWMSQTRKSSCGKLQEAPPQHNQFRGGGTSVGTHPQKGHGTRACWG